MDGLSKHSHAEELFKKLYEFVHSYNARIIITCRPIIQQFIRKSSEIKDKCHLYELNTFKASSLFEWIVLNKNSFEQTKHHQARSIYTILRQRVKQKEEKENDLCFQN